MEHNQRILGVNTQFNDINYPGLVCESFKTAVSFLDFDAVIIDSSSISDEYEKDYRNYNGKTLISKSESPIIANDFLRVKEQIKEMLIHGKNVFVIMSNNEDCYFYTWKTTYDGSGKNARKTDLVDLLNAFSFIPIEIKPTLIYGEKFYMVCNPPYSTFFNSTKHILHYEAYFEAKPVEQLLLSPNKTKTISAAYKFEKGNLVLLPSCNVNHDDEKEFKQWKKNGKVFLDALLELNNTLLNGINNYVLPLWSNSIKIPDESMVEATIEKEKTKLKKLEDKISKQSDHLNHIRNLKRLVTSNGSVLEQIVKEVLIKIGFSIQNTSIGRSDVIASYLNYNVVAEIKGVTKSAAEKHAAQLEKWVSQYIEENNQIPKALLIVNGFCDTPLTERTEEVFPDQMLKYCESRGHALISTTQLLCMYIEINNTPSCAQERITELLTCNGKYPRYVDYENYIEILNIADN